ncbi:MAG: hypothetical protein AB9891_15435 [Anaerolineaceae bacterium]
MKKQRFFQILLAGLSFITGIIASPLLENYFSKFFDTPANAVIITNFILIICVVIFLSALHIYLKISEENIHVEDERVLELIQRLGLTVRFHNYNTGRKDVNTFSTAIKYIRNAKEEIFVLDYHPKIGVTRYYDRSEEEIKAREKYYQIIIEKAKEGIHYKRLIQDPNGPANSVSRSQINDRIFIQHCEHVLNLQTNTTQPKASIKRTSVFLPETTFVIIDKKIIIWEIVVENPDTPENLRLAGDLIFNDELDEFSKPLSNLFHRIDDGATLITRIID